MEKKLLIIVSILIMVLSAYGQKIPTGYSDSPKFLDKFELGRNILVAYNMTPVYDVKGTPYLFEEFQNTHCNIVKLILLNVGVHGQRKHFPAQFRCDREIILTVTQVTVCILSMERARIIDH